MPADATSSTAADAAPSAGHDDFLWTYTEEPHKSRRIALIKAHPEVLKLCGPEPLTKWLVLAVVALQVSLAYSLQSTPFFSWTFWLVAYVLGATANQWLFLSIHEISHNLAFRSPLANRYLAIFANIPIGVPYSASFRPYHLTHHKSLGVDGLDTDLPTAYEAALLDSTLGKLFFCTFQIFFYAVRPVFIYRVPLTDIHYMNIAVQVLFNTVLVRYTSWNSLFYLVLSSFLAGSLHPAAAHFISEHYIFEPITEQQRHPQNKPPMETFSYYGWMSQIFLCVGSHVIHHDLPAVPWSRLEKVREIAPEFYDHLPSHESWLTVIPQFIFDKNVGMKCRVKRKEGGRRVGGVIPWKDSELEA